ncbi:MAG TPA: hypothetical protein VJ719_11300, partial [Chthoniobacterales bacterium]|nr:hypothetical protein [Chthoniobacterales bacterium]
MNLAPEPTQSQRGIPQLRPPDLAITPTTKPTGWRIVVFSLVLAIAAFIESYLPYYLADRYKPAHSAFLGQLVYTNDQDMYFSFIRQAWEGHNLFNNRLMGAPNEAAFLNLEFLAVGRVMRWFHLSENSGYQLWRLAGACFLIFGYSFVAALMFRGVRRYFLSAVIFAFAGGFGVFFLLGVAAGWLPNESFRTFGLDVWAGWLPFQQILTNPHFSLPHGLLLVGFGLFLLGEKRQHSILLYTACGILLALQGLVRPYDLISLFAVIPAFAGFEFLRRPDARVLLRRLLPLIISAPVLLYSIWLFKLHPVFKYWSQQGHNIPIWPPPYAGLLAYGAVGILAVVRLAQYRTNPLTAMDRFLCLWFAGIFCLSYGGLVTRKLGFSPQLAIPLFAPLVILACSVRLPMAPVNRRRLIAAVAVLAIAGHFGIISYYCQQRITAFGRDAWYAADDELAAYRWINETLPPESPMVALPPVGTRLCKYTSCLSVLGHRCVTPVYYPKLTQVQTILSGSEFGDRETATLHQLGGNFLYIGPEERALLGFDPDKV